MDAQTLYEGLIGHGLIVPVRVAGAFGRGVVFEDVLERVNAALGKHPGLATAEYFTFPPVIDRQIIEKTDYLESFPQLAGTVSSFFGKERQAKELAARVRAGQPWHEYLGMTEVSLNPAACYPLYPTITGALPEGGRLVTMTNWVFRHEPSPEPTRMQAFRVRELVRAGSADAVAAWRDEWLEAGLSFLKELELPVSTDVAADPFFGRAGKILADGQKAQKLKFELLVPVISVAQPTAVASFNYHQDHFGTVFGIRQADGTVAHSACVGFGLERIVMALFATHGFEVGAWPQHVRSKLWA